VIRPACGWTTGGNLFVNGNVNTISQPWVFALPAGYDKFELVIDFRVRDEFPSNLVTDAPNGFLTGKMSVDLAPLANNSGGYTGPIQTIFEAFRDKTAYQAVTGITPAVGAADLKIFNGGGMHAFRIQGTIDSNLALPSKARLMHFIFNIEYLNWNPSFSFPTGTISASEHPITGQLIPADGLIGATLNVHR